MKSNRKAFNNLAEVISTLPEDNLAVKLRLVAMLSWPAVMAQLSSILMEYIDAAMVGHLGSGPAASIGLVATTTWLFWGLGAAAVTGFSVQVAHSVGAGRTDLARSVVRQAFVAVFAVACLLALAGTLLSFRLPAWLGGGEAICGDATLYFLIFALSMPFMCINFLACSVLRCSGNMLVPGLVNVGMCLLDIVFNFFLIFPTREVCIGASAVVIPGAGLGVAGASIGSGLAFGVGGLYSVYYLIWRTPGLKHPFAGAGNVMRLSREVISRAASISWPVALERTVMCGAQIFITAIVAPLGTASIAANSFAVTAECLCYTPGYGVGEAATTLVGQSLGAGRKPLARSFGLICIITGSVIMAFLGMFMWLFSPEMMSLFTPDAEVCGLGVMALRTEAWAEPFFGVAIVAYGVFVGAGYTKVPAVTNFSSIWIVRVTLCMLLAPRYGLYGVWLAMCVELCVRGSLFAIEFFRGRWLRHFSPME